jgi:hypothetical protein
MSKSSHPDYVLLICACSYAPSASQYREEEQLHEMLLNPQIQQHLDQARMSSTMRAE